MNTWCVASNECVYACVFGPLPAKYFPHTKHADTEQHFSKSKSSSARFTVSRYGQSLDARLARSRRSAASLDASSADVALSSSSSASISACSAATAAARASKTAGAAFAASIAASTEEGTGAGAGA
eukprot:6500-Pelagococcus_subviridis.AAC.3